MEKETITPDEVYVDKQYNTLEGWRVYESKKYSEEEKINILKYCDKLENNYKIQLCKIRELRSFFSEDKKHIVRVD